MGKSNRQRRAAKVQRRAKRQHARGAGGGHRYDREWDGGRGRDPWSTPQELAAALLDFASAPALAPDDDTMTAAIDRLCTLDRAVVATEAERSALRVTAAAWAGGWQPSELVRQVRRSAKGAAARVAPIVIAADHLRWRAAELDPRWIDQLDRLPLPPVRSPAGWLVAWAEDEQLQWRDTVHAVVTLLRCLSSLRRIPILIPPPGTASSPGAPIDLAATTMNDPILERVRALLAQAESTTFDAEAEAFTAKAQELITRHAIDLAMLSAAGGHSERPITRRLPLDDPYVDAKSMLLQVVAESSRCRAVLHQRYALSSVVGFASDVAATEMLFTSLLVQAQTAMQTAAATAPPGARTRSRGFRAAFLVAFARRIGTRLEAINANVTAAADTDGGLLPVLAARSSLVDAAVDEMFGPLRATEVRSYDAAGWASGQLAADCAHLNSGDLASGARAREPEPNRDDLLQLAFE